jgi:hypothetical protein
MADGVQVQQQITIREPDDHTLAIVVIGDTVSVEVSRPGSFDIPTSTWLQIRAMLDMIVALEPSPE